MPALNDHGTEVSILEDFHTLDKWTASKEHDFRKVVGTRIVNQKGVDLSGIHGYLPDTYSDFAVKNIFSDKDKDTVAQDVKGEWEGTKLETAMEQLQLQLNCQDPENPFLVDDDVRIMSDDKQELLFAGGWFIRGWKIDLVLHHNRNGIKQVEFFRDEIRWVKASEDKKAVDESTEVFTSTYWLPY